MNSLLCTLALILLYWQVGSSLAFNCQNTCTTKSQPAFVNWAKFKVSNELFKEMNLLEEVDESSAANICGPLYVFADCMAKCEKSTVGRFWKNFATTVEYCKMEPTATTSRFLNCLATPSFYQDSAFWGAWKQSAKELLPIVKTIWKLDWLDAIWEWHFEEDSTLLEETSRLAMGHYKELARVLRKIPIYFQGPLDNCHTDAVEGAYDLFAALDLSEYIQTDYFSNEELEELELEAQLVMLINEMVRLEEMHAAKEDEDDQL